jgi:insulin-like growth factor 2 mRNA-binding protein 1
MCLYLQGGLKAVVWTDTLQTFLMFGGVIIVMILGTVNVGGPGVVWERSQQSDRLEFFK